MSEQPDLSEIILDGELPEDSLYEWNGAEWVAVVHKPYSRFGRGFWTPDDPSVFDAQPELPIAEPESVPIIRQFSDFVQRWTPEDAALYDVQLDEKRPPRNRDAERIGFFGSLLAIVLIIFVLGLFLWVCFGTLG